MCNNTHISTNNIVLVNFCSLLSKIAYNNRTIESETKQSKNHVLHLDMYL